MLVSSVLGFRPWCSSNGVFFSPVCIVNRITFNALFTLSVRLFPSSILANTRFFIVCIALSTVPFPVCILGGQYCISMFRALQNSLYSVEVNAPLSDLIFSGMPYKLNWFDRKLITSFVSDVLQIFAVGHLLNRSIAINICGSPFRFLLCNFPVKSICISCPGSDNFSNFPYLFFGIWYLKFLPVARQAVQSFTLCSISFRISGHQNIFASDSIFVVPEWPKCRISMSCLLKSMGTAIWSSKKTKPHRTRVCRKPLCILRARSLFSLFSYWSGLVSFPDLSPFWIWVFWGRAWN